MSGREDYITNPERQEHLYTTYSTTDIPDFWDELTAENHKEFEKYNCTGRCVEAREWIIALEESLAQYDPEFIIRKFTDAFKEKYGVECVSALHHNKTKTNYHIHLIFADRKLLEEPEVKIAARNMFYDETGKHHRTKKEVCDSDGQLRKGCRIIPKGDAYEKRLFGAKEEIFKSKDFEDEVKALFTELNNSLITDESKKLQVFDRNSVYLATKKIGKNNPKAEIIKADNAARQEWNKTADMALISSIPEEKILEIKKEHVTKEIQKSIKEHGTRPEKFAEILNKAIAFLSDMIRVARTPKKPKLEIDIKEFEAMQAIKVKLDDIAEQAKKLDVRILKKQEFVIHCKNFKKRHEENQNLRKLYERRARLKELPDQIVSEHGYRSVQAFMRAFDKSYAIVERYKKQMAKYDAAVRAGIVVDPDEKKSVIEQIQKIQEEHKIAQKTSKQKEIKRADEAR